LPRPLSPSHRRHSPLQFCFFIFLQVAALLLLFVSTSFSAFLSPAISAIPRVSGVQVRGSRCYWALFRCFFF
jgi:hypothetical protein